jgi:hypothetical protein
MESLYRSGEASKYQVRRMNQIKSVHRIKQIGTSPSGVPAAGNPPSRGETLGPELNPFLIPASACQAQNRPA